MRRRSWLPGLLATLVFTAPAWLPFLRPDLSLWQLYDGGNHLRKAFFLAQLIKDGAWYPRWIPQEYGGYGYPTFNFYAPAPYYTMLALAAALPKVGLYGALQLLGTAGAVGIVAGIYTLAWGLWRHAPAAFFVAGAIAYAPYILPDNLFISGWLPQVLGQALTLWLLAAALWLWRRAATGRSLAPAWWAIAGITTTMLLTHNASAVIAVPLMLLWLGCLSLWRRSRRGLVAAGSAALAGAAATGVLWVPALLETSLVQVERMFRGNLHYRNQFLAWPGFNPPLWGLQERSPYTVGSPLDFHLLYPNSAYGPTKLGWIQGLLFVGSVLTLIALAVRRWRRGRDTSAAASGQIASEWTAGAFDARLAVLSICFGLVVFLLCYSESFDWWLPVWERVAALRSLQLPSRFLPAALYGVTLAAGGSMALWLPAHHTRRAWPLAIAAVVVCGVVGMAKHPTPVDAGASHVVDTSLVIDTERKQPGFTDSTEEFLPRTTGYEEWHEGEARGFWLYERMFPETSWLAGRARAWQGQLAIRALHGGLLWQRADVEAGAGGATLAFHQLAFPGWRAWIDGQPAPVRPAGTIESEAIEPGFILVDVPAGAHQVALQFGADGPRLMGTTLSLLALLGVAGWLLVRARRSGPLPAFAHVERGEAQLAPATFGAAGIVVILAVAVMAGRTILSLRPPRAPDSPKDTVLVKNLVDDVVAGRASVSSPSGSVLGPDKFVDVRYLSVLAQDRPLRDAGPSTRRWLYTHPPTQIADDLVLPPEAYFQAGLALDPAMWDAPFGDGVRYLVTLTPQGGQAVTVFDAWVNPRAVGDQRRWIDVTVDLRPWAGQAVRLTLRTDPREDPQNDWAGWSEPSVVRLDPLTAARLLDSTAGIAKLALRP